MMIATENASASEIENQAEDHLSGNENQNENVNENEIVEMNVEIPHIAQDTKKKALKTMQAGHRIHDEAVNVQHIHTAQSSSFNS